MRGHALRATALVAWAALLAGCGDGGEAEVSDLAYAEVKAAAASGDADAFRNWFREVRGQQVAWTGRVVEVGREHGDEFVEVTMLTVDLDDAAPEEDAKFQISSGQGEALQPGQEVRFRGRLENYEWASKRPLLRLDVREIE